MDLVTHFQLLNRSKSDEVSAPRLGYKRTVAFALPPLLPHSEGDVSL